MEGLGEVVSELDRVDGGRSDDQFQITAFGQ